MDVLAFYKRLLLFIVTCIFLNSCAFFSMKQEDKIELSSQEQQKIDEYKAEVTLGRDMAGRLMQFYGVYGDEELIRYVNTVGQYVASQGDHPDRRYFFGILDTEEINAFACPGGYILITKGTLRVLKNEAELAMVLAHEIAHVGLQHMFNTLKAMEARELDKTAEEGGDSSSDLSYSMAVRRRPKSEGSKSAEVLTRYLSQSSGAGLSLLKAAKAGMNVLLEKGLDKKLEFEADAAGLDYAIRSGYHPSSFHIFLKRLEKSKKNKKSMKQLSKTHPTLKERKKNLLKQLTALGAKKSKGAKGRKRFSLVKKALPVKEK